MKPAQISFLDLLREKSKYVVPRWQRRYRWRRTDIERLIDDLLTVAVAGDRAAHYGGTMLTFPEPGPPGVVRTIRVVDGQQRLTTVSILLACIAEKLGPEGAHGEWTAQDIRDDLLTNPGPTNPGEPTEKHPKLRLQEGDEEEYRRGLEGEPEGSGAVTQAWKIIHRIVDRSDAGQLLEGLQRLGVVSISLDEHEDPQQIFESLNATGRPLTESEKVKNWLLLGLPDSRQEHLHRDCWLVMERALGAEHRSEPVDTFLRDLLRWRTGEVIGIDHVYENLRRWLVKHGENAGDVEDRVALCRELTRQARLYGILTGSAGSHPHGHVEREIRHLRAMGIHVHRPLSLRLLHDASRNVSGMTDHELARILAGIAAWVTRLWLAERSTNGMNRAATELAHGAGPRGDEDCVEYWLGRIRRLRNRRVGVPTDKEAEHGIRTRRAYGGHATRASKAVLCALMEAEHREESPARGRLTVEHVMPQKLTDEWKQALGPEAEEIHEQNRHRLANLTLSGDVTNSLLGTATFDKKCDVYRQSTIGLTRRLAEETEWNREALSRRAGELVRLALKRWPWTDRAVDPPEGREADRSTGNGGLRWRIEDGPWHAEDTASRMVRNVAGALLSLDRRNAERLAGKAIRPNIHPASLYPAGSKAAGSTMQAVPGHEDHVLDPHARDYRASAKRCREMGERCDVRVDVEGVEEVSRPQAFFRYLEQQGAGLPGQKNEWRGAKQRTSPLNSHGDRIGIFIGEEVLRLYIRTAHGVSEGRTSRIQQYSWKIDSAMADQKIVESPSHRDRSASVERKWTREDEDEWPDAADWLREQARRLQIIMADPG